MLPAHQLQGELAIPVHTYMQSCPHMHAPGGANIRASSCPKVPCAVIAVAIVVPFLPGFATLGMSQAWARSCPVTAALEDNGVFQSATLALNDLFAFLNILYCPRL